jgi:hypothetical protein
VHGGPPAAGPADTEMSEHSSSKRPRAPAPGIKVSQRAAARASELPRKMPWTPRNGGYKNSDQTLRLTTHATLMGRCLKSAGTRLSPRGSPNRSANFIPVFFTLLLILTLQQACSHTQVTYIRPLPSRAHCTARRTQCHTRISRPLCRALAAPTPPHRCRLRPRSHLHLYIKKTASASAGSPTYYSFDWHPSNPPLSHSGGQEASCSYHPRRRGGGGRG